MQRVAYWLFPLIAGGIAVFVIVFMIQINPDTPIFSGDEEESAAESPSLSSEEKSWLERFTMSEEKGYFYPVNEVTIRLDTGEKSAEERLYRLSVPLKDSYELFCVRQELQNSDLPYFFQKDGGAMILLVDSNDQTKLASLETKLKTYHITATVSPLKEE